MRDAVIDLMRRFGMTSVFANPGSTELPMFRDFPQDFRYVLGLQEAVVVGMADGYAQATRNASFVNLHSAAGVGNAMGNIFTAFKNRTPMVITAGQQARSILPFDPFLSSAQATELPKPYVKWSIEPARAQDVPLAIARAYYVAMHAAARAGAGVDSRRRLGPSRGTGAGTRRQHRDSPGAARAGADRRRARCQRTAGVRGGRRGRPRRRLGRSRARSPNAHNARVLGAPMSGRCSFPEDHRLFAGFLPAMREKIVELLGGHDLIFVIGAPAFTYHVEGTARTSRPARRCAS